ncbi:DUF456 domain-containing protein [Streptomyces sp. NPDC047737]|jgi:uncharacterized protein YqgC (DUF456 family)|uniref:DUF456 domain-containing protein n=1 Tax=unclassified Streptomyces TaxID=2593676 RepID=UPI0033F28629
MSVWQLVAVGALMLLGLVGVLVPGVPGQAIIWAAVLWWALTDPTQVAWGVLIGATALLLLNQALKALMPSRRPREAGVPRKTLTAGGLAAIAGFFVVPVVGGILGYVGAVYGAERLRLGSRAAGRASLRSVMRATGYSVLLELFLCLLVVGAWLGAVVWG